MNPAPSSKNIESIEEFTLYALDRSIEGLQQLVDDCKKCAGALHARSPEAFGLLSPLAVNLRDFDVFENDMVSLFEIDRSLMSDAQGSLLEVEANFRATLDRLADHLGQNDMTQLSQLLETELPGVLTRFQVLLPMLRDYVDVQYIRTAP
ncbi:MAG TPA: hypothetical protein DCZ95_07025 [Verrucomicrobia bacterium]|nr:MAG: hypothetical protein A2X46_06245 [Lentisphaerae bacterium GWF2_57_35]HBA83828.1 hypothetical protein [Verrucomicrobiota bacterium]